MDNIRAKNNQQGYIRLTELRKRIRANEILRQNKIPSLKLKTNV